MKENFREKKVLDRGFDESFFQADYHEWYYSSGLAFIEIADQTRKVGRQTWKTINMKFREKIREMFWKKFLEKSKLHKAKKKSIKNEWEISRSCMLLGVMRICLYQDSNADFNIKNKSQRLDQSTATGAVIGQHESEGIVNKKPTSRLCERFLRQQSFCSDLKVGNWISQSIFRV